MKSERNFEVSTSQDSFNKPLIVAEEYSALERDVLFNVVDIECELMRICGDNVAQQPIGELVAELKLRLFGSLYAGF